MTDLFDQLPYQRHSPTSKAAADAAKPNANTMRRALLDWLRANRPATDEQMQRGTGMDGSTQRPRRVELARAGFIRQAGVGKTSKGRAAVLWETT